MHGDNVLGISNIYRLVTKQKQPYQRITSEHFFFVTLGPTKNSQSPHSRDVSHFSHVILPFIFLSGISRSLTLSLEKNPFTFDLSKPNRRISRREASLNP